MLPGPGLPGAQNSVSGSVSQFVSLFGFLSQQIRLFSYSTEEKKSLMMLPRNVFRYMHERFFIHFA